MRINAVVRSAVWGHLYILERFAKVLTMKTLADALNEKPLVNGFTALHDSVLRALSARGDLCGQYLAQIKWEVSHGAHYDIRGTVGTDPGSDCPCRSRRSRLPRQCPQSPPGFAGRPLRRLSRRFKLQMPTTQKPVIYQLVVRYFGNTSQNNKKDGTISENGCGRFADINAEALNSLRRLGATHIWLTGILRQATLTDYSGINLPADVPNIVKGIAGSFYAVRDYYDVCPDYASTPANRMQEFEALVQRVHAAGILVIIDFVSNHVSRGYESVVNPAENLGHADDVTQFFSAQNNFFYLVSPPHQALHLSGPSAWNPPGIVFDGRFAREDGSPGHPPKATGNNITSPTPSSSDWYETIKLNYGFNFVSRQATYSPRPRTWDGADAILAYWQGKGVDGFRCDFAHYVPSEAWAFLMARARARRPAFFFAEAYPSVGSGDPVQSQDTLIQAGFDASITINLTTRSKVFTPTEISIATIARWWAFRIVCVGISSVTSRIMTNGGSLPQLSKARIPAQAGLARPKRDAS